MSNFVTNGGALPGTKTGGPNPAVPAGQQMTGAEMTTVMQAVTDIRTFLNLEINVQSYGADPTGSVDSSAAFTAALSALGSNPARLILPEGLYQLANNISIPGNVALVFNSALITVNSGKTLTVNGPVQADPRLQLFEGAGTVVLNTPDNVSVRWFGAAGNGSADDSAAVQNAVLAATSSGTGTTNSPVYFPAGNYLLKYSDALGAGLSTVRTFVIFRGDGPGATVLKFQPQSGQAGSYLYDGRSTAGGLINVEFRDMEFLCDGSVCGTPSTTVTVVSNGVTIGPDSSATIHLTSTTGLPAANGLLFVGIGGGALQPVSYGAVSGSTVTGCAAPNGGGTLATSDAVQLANPVNLFRAYGSNSRSPDQCFCFTRCWFQGDSLNPGIVLRLEGANNCDTNRFIDCRGYNMLSAISCVNDQAINHELTSCNFENMQGDIFYFTQGGGLNVLGGSYIFQGSASGGGAVNGNAGAGGSLLTIAPPISGITASFTFVSLKTENYDTALQMFRLVGDVNECNSQVNAIACNFGTTHLASATTLVSAIAEQQALIRFDSCNLQSAQDLTVAFLAGTPQFYTGVSLATKVLFRDCLVNTDFQSAVTWAGNAEGGIFSARGCRCSQPISGVTYAIAMDCDLAATVGQATGPNSGLNMNFQQLKSMSVWLPQWPATGTAATQVPGGIILPPGSIVKSISVLMAARGSGDNSPIQLRVQNHGGGYVYGSESAPSAAQGAHELIIDNIFRLVTAGNDLKIEITLVTFAGVDGFVYPMILGDVFVVEYY